MDLKEVNSVGIYLKPNAVWPGCIKVSRCHSYSTPPTLWVQLPYARCDTPFNSLYFWYFSNSWSLTRLQYLVRTAAVLVLVCIPYVHAYSTIVFCGDVDIRVPDVYHGGATQKWRHQPLWVKTVRASAAERVVTYPSIYETLRSDWLCTYLITHFYIIRVVSHAGILNGPVL